MTYHQSTDSGGGYENPSLNEVDSYGSPSAPVITNYESTATVADADSYGSPAAPVISYQEPQSYSAPVKVKKSVNPGSTPPVQIEEIDDGYGAPLAPVVSASAPLQRWDTMIH